MSIGIDQPPPPTSCSSFFARNSERYRWLKSRWEISYLKKHTISSFSWLSTRIFCRVNKFLDHLKFCKFFSSWPWKADRILQVQFNFHLHFHTRIHKYKEVKLIHLALDKYLQPFPLKLQLPLCHTNLPIFIYYKFVHSILAMIWQPLSPILFSAIFMLSYTSKYIWVLLY